MPTLLKTDSKLKNKGLFDDDYTRCFLYFNPEGRDNYNFVVDNWTKVNFL